MFHNGNDTNYENTNKKLEPILRIFSLFSPVMSNE